MTKHAPRFAFILVASVLVPACGGGGGGGGAKVPRLTVLSSGGSAQGSTVPGTAVGGGSVGPSIVAGTGDIRVGVNRPPRPAVLPVPPTTGTEVTSLATDQTIASGNALVSGTVTGSGAATRMITCDEGDIVVSGTLNGGQNGGAPIQLVLFAPNGNVFVSGIVRTASVDGVPSGDAGGPLIISALRIIVTGTIDSRGEDNPAGNAGNGGVVQLVSAAGGNDILVSGEIDSSGGASAAGDGGDGGTLVIGALTDAEMTGTLTADGGEATSTSDSPSGGNGGVIAIEGPARVLVDGSISHNGGRSTGSGTGAVGGNGGVFAINVSGTPSGAVFVYGRRSSNGGNATAASGTAGNPIVGGDGGAFMIGAINSPNAPSVIEFGALIHIADGGDSSDEGGSVATLALLVFVSNAPTPNGNIICSATMHATGGDGGNVGGAVDTQALAGTGNGDITFSGKVTTTGGKGGVTPGTGGGVQVLAGAAGGVADAGSLTFSGDIDASGGSSSAPAAVDVAGADGGTILLRGYGLTSRVTVLPGCSLVSNGGDSTGTSAGGKGGVIAVVTIARAISAAGSYSSRGGNATGAGGTGGSGTGVFLHADFDADGAGGDITFEAGSRIDASGGSGATGGAGGQVMFEADGNDSDGIGNGIVVNNGSIVTRGGTSNGNGGNVTFDGLNAAGTVGPAAGTQDRSGQGAGVDGAFTSQ